MFTDSCSTEKSIRDWCWIIIGFRDKHLRTYLFFSGREREVGKWILNHRLWASIVEDTWMCGLPSIEMWKVARISTASPANAGRLPRLLWERDLPGGICRNLPWPLRGFWSCARCPGVKWNHSETKYIFRSGLVSSWNQSVVIKGFLNFKF